MRLLKREQRHKSITVQVTKIFSLSSWRIIALFSSMTLLYGCSAIDADKNQTNTSSTISTTSTTSKTTTNSTSADSLTGTGSALPLVNWPAAAPYKVVEKDGVMMKQGRFPNGKFGGTLVRYCIEPKVLNPWTATDAVSQELGCLMFSGLASLDAFSGEIIPDLAEKIDLDKDGVTYTVKLRKGLTWSDGKPLGASDVAFTWNTIVNGGYGNSSMRDVSTIGGKSPQVTIIDQLTVKFVTAAPFGPFKRLLAEPIAPEHIVKPIINAPDGRRAFDRLWTANSDPKSFVVNGPFKLKRYLQSQRIEFVPNPSYAGVNAEGKRLPYLGQLTFLIVADSNTILLKFKAQETDLALIRPKAVVEMMAARSKENFQLYNLGASTTSLFIAFNMNRRVNAKTKKPYVPTYKSEWFNDLNFRQAVNHALNREQMVANCFNGIGLPLTAAESSVSPFCNRNLKPIKADLTYSLSLLEQSGFKKREDGKLYDKNGKRVEFTMVTAAGSSFNEIAGNMIATDLATLGIKVNLQFLDFSILVDKIGNSLEWDTCLYALKPGDSLEPNESSNIYKSDGRMHLFDQRLPDKNGKVVTSDARPWEKRLDELFLKGATTVDKTQRQAIYNEYQQIIYQQAPFVFLVTYLEIYGARNTVKNYFPTPLTQSTSGLHNIEEIFKE